jgi:hypothetical protein
LAEPSINAIVREHVAASVPQHMGMHVEAQPSHVSSPLDDAGIISGLIGPPRSEVNTKGLSEASRIFRSPASSSRSSVCMLSGSVANFSGGRDWFEKLGLLHAASE